MSEPIVSVIVPVYNVREYLPACVDSILSQDFKDIEMLLIDDGSKDGSEVICDEYAAKYPEIHVVHQKNAGVSAARNVGLRSSSAPYVFFVDSDDFIAPDLISRLFALINDENCDIAIGAIKQYYSQDKILDSRLEFEHKALLLGDEILPPFFGINSEFLSSCCKIFKKEIIENILFEDIKSGEDSLFLWEPLKRAKAVAIDPDAIYFYRIRENSASHSTFKESHLSFLDVNRRIFEEVTESRPELHVFALQKYVLAHVAMLNMIALSKRVDKRYSTRIVRSLRGKFGEYFRTSKHSLLRRFSTLLAAYAFPIYKIFYRFYRRLNP